MRVIVLTVLGSTITYLSNIIVGVEERWSSILCIALSCSQIQESYFWGCWCGLSLLIVRFLNPESHKRLSVCLIRVCLCVALKRVNRFGCDFFHLENCSPAIVSRHALPKLPFQDHDLSSRYIPSPFVIGVLDIHMCLNNNFWCWVILALFYVCNYIKILAMVCCNDIGIIFRVYGSTIGIIDFNETVILRSSWLNYNWASWAITG